MVDPIHWDVKLPHWIESGDKITLHMPSEELRKLSNDKNIRFCDKMYGVIELGDPAKIKSSNTVPLAK
jgi:hypothetical protein